MERERSNFPPFFFCSKGRFLTNSFHHIENVFLCVLIKLAECLEHLKEVIKHLKMP